MNPISYLALGDSYTIGTSVSAEQRWPRQLIDHLVAREGPTQHTPTPTLDIVAVNGWTTRDLLHGIPKADLLPRYDLVSLLIGVNNQFEGLSVEAYREEFAALLTIAVDKAGGKAESVLVVSIPDYGYTPFGADRSNISEEIDGFNAIAREVSGDGGVLFCDITAISRQARTTPGLIADDDLHPSAEQYRRWVKEVLVEAVRLPAPRPTG